MVSAIAAGLAVYFLLRLMFKTTAVQCPDCQARFLSNHRCPVTRKTYIVR